MHIHAIFLPVIVLQHGVYILYNNYILSCILEIIIMNTAVHI